MSTSRRSVSTGSPYEPLIGISRAVRIGSLICVSGTAPLGPDGKTVGIGDPAAQVRRCFEISQVARFIDPEWLVETEIDAVVEAEAV